MRGLRERRRPGHFRICGACGKRNKSRRSSCMRCGEPLRGIPEATPGAALARPPPPRRYRYLVAAVAVVAVAAGVAVHRVFRGGTLAPAGQTLAGGESAEEAPTPDAGPPSSADVAVPADAGQTARTLERAERHLAQGDFRAAASLLSDAARLSPEDARIANAYGRALLGLGSRDRALRQFERAARLASGVVAYRLDLARALASAGRVREAAREYEAVAALEPGNAAAAEGLAQVQPAAPGAAPGTVDLGGASGTGERPADGVFTNEDLRREPRPSPSPSPSPSPD